MGLARNRAGNVFPGISEAFLLPGEPEELGPETGTTC